MRKWEGEAPAEPLSLQGRSTRAASKERDGGSTENAPKGQWKPAQGKFAKQAPPWVRWSEELVP